MRFLEQLLMTRPRLLDLLHIAGLVNATSQTIQTELDALAKHAQGASRALEIGSYQGVSAAAIAASLSETGVLYCVDPWENAGRASNPCRRIFERHLNRIGIRKRVSVIQGFSHEVAHLIPEGLDFAFVDGDHSEEGIAMDWAIVIAKLRVGGVACLHDVVVPAFEPERRHGSVDFFERVIKADRRFEILELVHSMAAMRRIA